MDIVQSALISLLEGVVQSIRDDVVDTLSQYAAWYWLGIWGAISIWLFGFLTGILLLDGKYQESQKSCRLLENALRRWEAEAGEFEIDVHREARRAARGDDEDLDIGFRSEGESED